MTQKRFVSWAAVSSLPQAKKISLEDQLAVNRAHAERRGGTVVAELVVPGESRHIVLFEDAARKIPAYAQLRELIDQQAFDVLIFLDRSRLGRKASLSMSVVELCHEAGIVTYATESPPASLEAASTYDDMLIGAIKSVGAQQEIVKLQERHRMGMEARIQRGDFPGIVLWGWQVEYEIVEGKKPKRQIVVDEEAATVIRLIVQLYLRHGLGLKAIAEELNRQGYQSPSGKAWTKTHLYQIIDRIWRYAGYQEFNRRPRHKSLDKKYVRAKSKWPAIISEADALAVEESRQYRGGQRRRVASPHRYSGVVYCALCGDPLTAQWTFSTNRRDPSIRYEREQYRCYHNGILRHKRASIPAHRIDAAVKLAIEQLQDKAARERLSQVTPDHTQQIQEQIDRWSKMIETTNAAILRADDAYISGIMDLERYNRQVDRLKAQLVEQTKELETWHTRLAAQSFADQRPLRLEEVAQHGIEMISTDDIATARTWFHKHMRIWMQDCEIIEVEFL